MTSPTPLHVHNADIPLDPRTDDYSVSRIFGMLIEPERGWVLPDFLEYQDAEESPMAGGDNQMEEGATGTSVVTDQISVHIPSTSDIVEVCCNPDDHLSPSLPSEYHHDECDSQFHFVPEGHACQVHETVVWEAAAVATWEAEHTPLTTYVTIDTEEHDFDKENRNPNQEDHKDAEEVLRSRQDAQRMGPRRRGRRGG